MQANFHWYCLAQQITYQVSCYSAPGGAERLPLPTAIYLLGCVCVCVIAILVVVVVVVLLFFSSFLFILFSLFPFHLSFFY
ncbi:hypothetical protein V8C37DRAFT_372904 [Trichoderma ceciliae]